MSDVKEQVIRIIAEQAVVEPSDITMEQSLEDLSIDSSAVRVAFPLELEFPRFRGRLWA